MSVRVTTSFKDHMRKEILKTIPKELLNKPFSQIRSNGGGDKLLAAAKRRETERKRDSERNHGALIKDVASHLEAKHRDKKYFY